MVSSKTKSIKNLKQLISEEEVHKAKDKENRTPPGSVGEELAPPPPIFAQFTSQALGQPRSQPSSPYLGPSDPFGSREEGSHKKTAATGHHGEAAAKERPKSFQPYANKHSSQPSQTGKDPRGEQSGHGTTERVQKRTWGKGSGVVKQAAARATSSVPSLGWVPAPSQPARMPPVRSW